jgi:hypothetical protein
VIPTVPEHGRDANTVPFAHGAIGSAGDQVFVDGFVIRMDANGTRTGQYGVSKGKRIVLP